MRKWLDIYVFHHAKKICYLLHTFTGLGGETSNKIMNYPISTPFYLDIKLMIPILISAFAILVAVSGVCLCFRKSECFFYFLHALLLWNICSQNIQFHCCSADRRSLGTPTSSTYFKQNQRNAQQVYMTVKKSTPMKNVDVTDLDPIPRKRTTIMNNHQMLFLIDLMI